MRTYARRTTTSITWSWSDINPENGPVRGTDRKRRRWTVRHDGSNEYQDRPWLAYGPGGVLKTKRGVVRRFETALSAMAACERACEEASS